MPIKLTGCLVCSFVVGRARFERATIALKVRCSTGWANDPTKKDYCTRYLEFCNLFLIFDTLLNYPLMTKQKPYSVLYSMLMFKFLYWHLKTIRQFLNKIINLMNKIQVMEVQYMLLIYKTLWTTLIHFIIWLSLTTLLTTAVVFI